MDFRIDDSYPVPPTQEKNVKDAAGRSSTKDRAHTRVTGRFHGSAQRGAKEVCAVRTHSFPSALSSMMCPQLHLQVLLFERSGSKAD